MTRKAYFKNTAILFVSMAVTKIVGAVFKIPLANVLGGTGMGYFSTAFGIYSPVFALTAAGIPAVIMRMTAQNLAAGRPENSLRIKRTALALAGLAGLLGAVLIELFAKPFADYISGSPLSVPAIRAIAPALIFCCTASVYRGYYEGMADVVPSSAASVAEAVSRAAVGLSLSYGIIFRAKRCFEAGEAVFGTDCATYEQAYSAALPYAAAGAVAAVSVSELCGLIALIIIDKRRAARNKRVTAAFAAEAPPDGRRVTAARLIKEMLPIAASALVMNCVSFVDLLTVTRAVSAAAAADPDYFARRFAGALSYCGGVGGLANFLYGSYTGIAMSLFMLIPSFAGMTEKTSLPEIAAAWEKRDLRLLAEKTEELFRAAAVIGFPACLGAAVLGKPILSLLYSSRAAEVDCCAASFGVLCAGGMFMVLTTALFGVFQVIGKPHYPLFLMAGSVALKFILNTALISIPRLNIAGAALSSAVCYFLTALSGGLLLKKQMPDGFSVIRAVRLPFFGSLICAAGALCAYELLCDRLDRILTIVFSVAMGGFVYVLSLIAAGFFSRFRRLRGTNPLFLKKGLAKQKKIM